MSRYICFTKTVADTRVKVEPGSVKVKPGTIKVEPGNVKPEPTSPEPLEAWRVKYAVPLVYHSEEDGEWAGRHAVVSLFTKEAGVIVIDRDDDDGGGNIGFEPEERMARRKTQPWTLAPSTTGGT
jgi:hypothetical protein